MSNITQDSSNERPKKPLTDQKDRLLLLFSIVLGYAFFEMIFFSELGLGVVLFTVLLYAFVHIYGRKAESFNPKRGALLYVPIALLLLCFFLFSNELLAFFNLVLLVFLVIIHIMDMFDVRQKPHWTPNTIADFFNGSVVSPFINADKIFKAPLVNSKNTKGKSTLLKVVIALVLIIPLVLIVLALLASADKAFLNLVENVINELTKLFDNITQQVLNIILGCIGAIFIYSAFYTWRRKALKPINAYKAASKIRLLDPVIGITISVVFNIIYIVFLCVQANNLFSALQGRLPDGFTFAEYARQGFFQLCVVAFINLGISAFIRLFSKGEKSKSGQVLAILQILLYFLSFLLIVSALSKMFLYIQTYTLTPLRVYTSWFMLLLACIFVILTIKQLKPDFKCFKALCITFVTLYLALNFACVDGLIARYNINKYLENPQERDIDMYNLQHLSSSAIPYIAKLQDNNDSSVRERAKSIVQVYANHKIAYRDFNLSDYLAVKTAKK